MDDRTFAGLASIVIVLIWLVSLAFFGFGITATYLSFHYKSLEPAQAETANSVNLDFEPPNGPQTNLQYLVDAWAKKQSFDSSIIIYDLDNGQVVASHNPDKIFFGASLYKLSVVYHGYKLVDSREWLLSGNLSAEQTVKECLNLAISKSDSSCAERLLYLMNDKSIAKLDLSASDMINVLQKIWAREGISNESWELLMDSMLNQPIDYRYGLPYGFKQSKVYNKVGYEEDEYYHDSAIVVTPSGRAFAIAVLTNAFNYHQIADLGRQIEQKIL